VGKKTFLIVKVGNKNTLPTLPKMLINYSLLYTFNKEVLTRLYLVLTVLTLAY